MTVLSFHLCQFTSVLTVRWFSGSDSDHVCILWGKSQAITVTHNLICPFNGSGIEGAEMEAVLSAIEWKVDWVRGRLSER